MFRLAVVLCGADRSWRLGAVLVPAWGGGGGGGLTGGSRCGGVEGVLRCDVRGFG